MKTHWGAMLKQIRYLDWKKDKQKIKQKVLVPVEYLFNNHYFDDKKWCYVLIPEDSQPLYDKKE